MRSRAVYGRVQWANTSSSLAAETWIYSVPVRAENIGPSTGQMVRVRRLRFSNTEWQGVANC